MKEEKTNLIEEAKRLVNDYCRLEFGEDAVADFTDLSRVPIAYTMSEDGRHEIQVCLNLPDYNIETFIDGSRVRRDQYGSLEEMIKDVLPYLDFGDLVSVGEELDSIIEDAKNRCGEQATELVLGKHQDSLAREQGSP